MRQPGVGSQGQYVATGLYRLGIVNGHARMASPLWSKTRCRAMKSCHHGRKDAPVWRRNTFVEETRPMTLRNDVLHKAFTLLVVPDHPMPSRFLTFPLSFLSSATIACCPVFHLVMSRWKSSRFRPSFRPGRPARARLDHPQRGARLPGGCCRIIEAPSVDTGLETDKTCFSMT